MDVSKLKVTELRAELSDRGLDTKGVKAVLVQRLLKAIEEETGEEQEQHTVLDTSTEETSDSEQRRFSKDSEPDQDPLLQDNRESSPETETASAAPSVAVEPPTSEKDLSEVDEPDGSPQNAEESSSSNEVAYQQEDSTEYQQDNASSDVRADYQIEDSTNTNDYQQSDSNVSSEFTKDKPVVYQENNSVEFQQGDNANQQWTNQQDEFSANKEEAAPGAEPIEAESTTTHNGHSGQEKGDESKAASAADDERMDTSVVDSDKPDGEEEEDEGRSRKRRDRKNRWGPCDPISEDGGTPDKRRKTGSESEDGGSSRRDRSRDHSRSKDKTPEPEIKKPPQVEKPESEPEIDPEAFTLAWYDSDLNLVIDQDSFTYGSPMSDQGFVYMWAGARATYGFNKGKIYYEVNLKEFCDTSNYEADIYPHQLRVGVSLKNASLQLGEAEHSYAWETTGQLVANNEYKLFGQAANVEDTVGVLLDFDSDAEFIIVKFTLNGEVLKLVRRIVKEPEPVDSEYEDVEEQVTDEDDAEEEDEEEEKKEENEKKEDEEVTAKEEVKEESEKKEAPKEGEEKMEGVEEEIKEGQEEKKEEEPDKEGKEEKEKSAPVKKPKQKKYKTIITKQKLPKKELPVEYEYLPAEEGDEVAFRISKANLGEQHLFPHILTKNIKFEANFGQKDEPWFPAPEAEEGYVFPREISVDDRELGAVRPEKRADCEMLMMCGLPGAGKTHWVREHLTNNREKLYNVFGTFSLTNKMKINSEPLRDHIKGKWVQVIDKTTKCLNRLLELGYSRRRNYILDQTNVYVSAQKRKMRSYFGFQRKAMVVVPSKEDYETRLAAHREKEGRDDVPPDHVILEMKANFKLPEVGELFEEVIFVEEQLEEAQKLIAEYNKEGKDAGFGQSRDQARGHGGPPGHRRRDSRDRGADYPRRGGPPPFGRGGFAARGGRMDHRMEHRPPMGGGMGWGGPPRDRRGGMGGGRGGGRWGGDRDDGRGPRGGGYGGRGGFGNRGPPPMHRGGDGEEGDAGPPPRREGGWRGGDDRRGGGRGGRDDRSGGRGGWGGSSRQGGGSWGGPPGGPDKSGEGGYGGSGRGGFEGRGRGRGGFGSNERRGGGGDHRSGDKGKGPYQQGGGWGGNQGNTGAMQQHQGWGGHQQGGWGGQGQNQQWNQWNQQNWQNQWNQWNQQQWAGYGNQQQQQGQQGGSGSQTSALANSGTHAAAATPTNQNQAASYGATGAAANTAANTAQGYNAAAYGNQAAAGYNAANYSVNQWTAAQYQQYYAAQGWTQNADGSYNCPQNWNAQNWSGYGYSTTGQTPATTGQTSQSASK